MYALLYLVIQLAFVRNAAAELSCVPVTECPEFVAILQRKSPSGANYDLVRSAHCGFEGTVGKVWCSVPTQRPAIRSQSLEDDLFPNDTECGKAVSSNKIFGGTAPGIDEYPWMALLYYNINGVVEYRCGGVLISKRYVLTAAHCLEPSLKYVILGEYGPDCSERPQKVQIKERIPHPSYQRGSTEHDIALLRLKRDVVFSDFIAPICLPLKGRQDAEELTAGTPLRTVGWGHTEKKLVSPIKLQLDVAVASRAYCSETQGMKIRSTQICAGSEVGKDNCQGDSGGPLMQLDANTVTWRQVGVVSYSRRSCATLGIPAVYTYVPPYLDWIYKTVY